MAKQLLELLVFANTLGVSHCRLDSDCVSVKHLDFRDDVIKIEVHGFEKVHLEPLGINTDMEVEELVDSGNVLSKLHGFGSSTERNGDGGVKCDLMSIGIIIFMLLVGLAPF